MDSLPGSVKGNVGFPAGWRRGQGKWGVSAAKPGENPGVIGGKPTASGENVHRSAFVIGRIAAAIASPGREPAQQPLP